MTQTFMEAKGFAPVSRLTLAPVVVIVDEEYEAWKKEMGLDVELTDQQVIEIARYELQGC
jgi:hypothetical protein